MIWRDKAAKPCVVFSKSRKKSNHQDQEMKNALLGVCLPFESRFRKPTDNGAAALLKGCEPMGKAAPEFSVDMLSGRITLLLSHFSPLVGTGFTKRHQNKTVLMCSGSVFMRSVFD